MVYYRYRTYSERLGPANAKSILLHYFGVVGLCYLIWQIRLYILYYSEKCPTKARTRISVTTTSVTTTTTTSTTAAVLQDYIDEEEAEMPELPDFRPYWATIVCAVSQSNNLALTLFRKYLDFSTYYIVLLVVGVNTIIIFVLSKHLWRAFFIKKAKKGSLPEESSGVPPLVKRHDSNWVSINMEDNNANIACMDDNFCIEVILAAFDFFRVSDTTKEE